MEPITIGSDETAAASKIYPKLPSTETAAVVDYIQNQVDSVSYEIDKIIGLKKDENGIVYYNVQWLAHTWIPESVLSPFQFLIDKFCQENEQAKPDNQTIKMTEQVIEEGCSPQVCCEVETADNNEQTEKADNNFSNMHEIAANDANEKNENSDKLTCPKCQQSFFLKSNWEVHVLFCTKDQNGGAKDGIEPDDEAIKTGANMTEASSTMFEVSTVKEALKLSQTFEYIPLTIPLECTACNKRLPSGNTLGDVDMSNLLWNATKKNLGDNVEVFACQECHRDYLYKHPLVTENPVKVAPDDENKVVAKPFKCSICNRSFEFANEMYEHEVKHSNLPNRYACSKCSEKFHTRNGLQEHYKSTENDCTARQCNICLREFVHGNHLRRHMTIHAGIKPFTCVICSHEFNQKSDLQRHQKRHTVDGRLTCLKCALIYDTVEELRQHILIHQNKEDKIVFKCTQCPKTFGRKSHFKRHLSIHEGVKPFSCEECGKSFNQRTDLKRHQLSHARKKAKVDLKETGDLTSGFCCEICQKVFPQEEILAAHKTVHEQIENTGLAY